TQPSSACHCPRGSKLPHQALNTWVSQSSTPTVQRKLDPPRFFLEHRQAGPTHTHTHTLAHTHTRAHTHAHTQTHTHACMHTHTHTRTQTHARRHTHANTRY